MSRNGRVRRSARAQALVEFAIAAPIFFLILFGIIDFGRYVYYTQVLNNGPRGHPVRHRPRRAGPAGRTALTIHRAPTSSTSYGTTPLVVIGLEDTGVLDIQVAWIRTTRVTVA